MRAEFKAFFAASGAQIDVTEGPRAYYNIRTDRLHMPPIGTFHMAADITAPWRMNWPRTVSG